MEHLFSGPEFKVDLHRMIERRDRGHHKCTRVLKRELVDTLAPRIVNDAYELGRRRHCFRRSWH
ncbi:MAG: hypothetical protein ACXW6T_15225 [Candidatus Binatia bacterium]